MRDPQPLIFDWTDGECAEEVAGAIQDLSRGLAGAAVGGADAAAGTDTDNARGRAVRLERLLVAGAFGEALALCRTVGPGDRAALFLAVIRRLEARWQTDGVGFSDLAFAFYLLRHLIEHALPAGAGIEHALPAGAGIEHALPAGAGAAKSPAHPGSVLSAAAPRVLVALAHGEGHSFGAQILAADLAASGCRVDIDLGADGAALCRRLARAHVDVLALSVGHDGALHGLADLITDLRAASCNGRLAIVLGGAALAEPRAQYTFLGADGIALSATEAVGWIAARHAACRPHHRI